MRYLSLLILTLVLVSCGTDSHHFKIDGRLLNLNQGEFYVYSTDGAIEGFDTIHVVAGRFTYEVECNKVGTLVIVFPNFSEQPVFTQPGKSVSFEGDAHKLKELKVKGTNENKLMNQFREQAVNASPQEIKHYVELIAQDHPQSIVPLYLIRKHLIQSDLPDYKLAAKLCDILQKAQPSNGNLKVLHKQIKDIANSNEQTSLPAFKAKDIDGNNIKLSDLKKGDAIIYLWASWEYESCNMQRAIRDIKRENPDFHALGICLDMSEKDCRRILKRDDVDLLPVVCNKTMYDDLLLSKLGFFNIPDNIILKNGKIVDRNITTAELRKKFQ